MNNSYIQGRIIRVLVDSLLAAGYAIDVNTRETTELASSRDRAALALARGEKQP